MKTNGQDSTKGRKLKTIIVGVVAAIVILFVGIWAISAAMNSSVTKEPENTETSNQSEPQTQLGTDPVSPSNQYVSSNEPAVVETPTATAMPTTGPAEVVLSAIMLGVVVYLVTLNVNLVKENR